MQLDKQTRDLKRSCLSLRDRLLFAPQIHQGETFYHIEDTSDSKFYRIGYAQYVFVSLLDGKTSFSAALAITARELGSDALSEQEATQLAQWLLQNKLATFVDDLSHQKPSRATKKSIFQQLNPFWLKLPLGNPDVLFSAALPYCRWLFSPVCLLAVFFLYALATVSIVQDWEKFVAGSQSIFVPGNWVGMLSCWVLLKIIHEFSHGVTCKYFGGSVKETGLIFILFAPMAYVDVTSTWRFASKWHRIFVAGAGMLVELLIAAIAAIAWSHTTSQLTAQLLYNVVLTAGLSTILFNANPLMRFDGYFILSDFLEIPNLYEEGSKQTQKLMGWLFLGTSTLPFETGCSLGRMIFLRVYGLAASCWKLVICASLLVGASTMFHGAGIILGVVGTMLWSGSPLLKSLQSWHHQFFESRPAFFRALVVTTMFGLALWSLWAIVPNPLSLQVPCIVDYQKAAFVRASSDGFLDEVMAIDGQFVLAGTPLARLRNDELDVEIARLQSELNQSQQRARNARNEHQPSIVQVELEQQRSIRHELNDKRTQLDSLTVVAPRDGHIVAKNLHTLVHTYVHKGDELLILGNEDQKELTISVGQDDIQDALPHLGERVQVRIGSRGAISGTLLRIEPRASTTLQHEAFAASAGGPIPVQPTSDPSGHAVEFHEPRFTGLIAIESDTATNLYCGERGNVRIGLRSQTVGRWAYSTLKEFIESRMNSSES